MTPCHGYRIMQPIKRLTNGRIKIGIKTLCAILSHFEKEKLIESVETTDRKKLLV